MGIIKKGITRIQNDINTRLPYAICAASHNWLCSTHRPPNSQISSPVSSSSDTLQAASTQKERFDYLALEVALARALLYGRQTARAEELSQEQN